MADNQNKKPTNTGKPAQPAETAKTASANSAPNAKAAEAKAQKGGNKNTKNATNGAGGAAAKSKKGDGSKIAISMLSFFLGILFTLIVLVGTVLGAGMTMLNTDLNKVFDMAGIDNVDDEGNYVYINTDKNNGGVGTVLDLTKAFTGLMGDMNTLCVDKINDLVPAVDMLLENGYKFIDDVVDFDKEGFESAPVSSYMQIINNALLNVKTSKLVDKIGMGEITESNVIVKSLLKGAEAQYATVVGTELKLPVFYDYYSYNDRLGYFRDEPVNGQEAYPDNLSQDYLQKVTTHEDAGATSDVYKLYYVPCKITANGIEEAEYIPQKISVKDSSSGSDVNYIFSVLSFGEDTQFIAVIPNDNQEFSIDFATLTPDCHYLSDYARNYYTGPKKVDNVYKVTTLSNINFFKNNAGETIEYDPLLLSDLLSDPYKPLYAVPVTEVTGNNSDVINQVFNNISVGELMDGEVVFEDVIDDIEFASFTNKVTPDNATMCHLVYNVTNVKKVGDNYTAIYDKGGANEVSNAVVVVENGYISKVTDAEGNELKGCTVGEVAPMTKDLTIEKCMDIKVGDAIMTYIGYGIYGVKQATEATEPISGSTYNYTGKYKDGATEYDCYMYVYDDAIETAWYVKDGAVVEVTGTKVTQVPDRVNGLKSDLSLGDIVAIDNASPLVLQSLKDSKISEISTKIDTLPLKEIIEIKDDSSKILKALQDTPLGSLESRINELTVNDVFDGNNNVLFNQLGDVKLVNLGEEVDKVAVQRLYASEVYVLPDNTSPMQVVDYNAGWTYYTVGVNSANNEYEFQLVGGTGSLTLDEFNNRGNTVYYTYGDGDPATEPIKIVGFNEKWLYYEKDGNHYNLTQRNAAGLTGTEYDDALGKLTATDWADSGKPVYYSFGQAKDMWRLLLYKNGTEKAYTINNFNNMVSTTADTVYSSTLFDLQDAGVIDANTELTKKIRVITGTAPNLEVGYVKIESDGTIGTAPNDTEATPIGALTLEQLINAVISFS